MRFNEREKASESASPCAVLKKDKRFKYRKKTKKDLEMSQHEKKRAFMKHNC